MGHCTKKNSGKENNELVKKVDLAQQESPVFGDFAQLVKTDLLNLNVTKAQVETLPRNEIQAIVCISISSIRINFWQNEFVNWRFYSFLWKYLIAASYLFATLASIAAL